ncbi:MAG: phage major capsid protein [Oscillospiraceae bacterium]
MLEKFFSTADSAVLFPEYVSRAVKQGISQSNILENIIAANTVINSMDYRNLVTNSTEDEQELKIVEEGGFIPQTEIKLSENLVRLTKRGRMLAASYEALRFQRLDLFTVALKQIGSYIASTQLKDAVTVLIKGDGNTNPASTCQTAAVNTLTYNDLITLWSRFENFEMNTLLVSPDMMVKMLGIAELQNPQTGLNFQGTGVLSTPLGAKLMKSSAVPSGTIIALDNRFALEMVSAGNVNVEYDKLIDCQLERAAITCITGFSKIFPEAVKVMTLKTA